MACAFMVLAKTTKAREKHKLHLCATCLYRPYPIDDPKSPCLVCFRKRTRCRWEEGGVK